MLSPLEAEIKRISNLKNYKGLTQPELEKIANLNLKLKEFHTNSPFYYEVKDSPGVQHPDSIEDIKVAEEKFKYYIANFNIENASDIGVLRNLIFNELLELKLQKDINKQAVENKGIPSKLTEQLSEAQNQSSILKKKLGIENVDNKVNELTDLKKLEKRFQEYIVANRHEFTLDVPMICEKCNHEAKYSYLLRKRVKDFDAISHPWFAGRWFFNYPVFKFVKEGILTKQQAAEILSKASESPDVQSAFSEKYNIDYIDYVLDHWAEITSFLIKK